VFEVMFSAGGNAVHFRHGLLPGLMVYANLASWEAIYIVRAPASRKSDASCHGNGSRTTT